MIARGINRTPPSYRIRNAVDEGRWISAAIIGRRSIGGFVIETCGLHRSFSQSFLFGLVFGRRAIIGRPYFYPTTLESACACAARLGAADRHKDNK